MHNLIISEKHCLTAPFYSTEPIFLEFPEFKGHTRRDYWLAIIREVLNMHRFIKKFNLKEIQREEVLSMAILGIFRYRAVKEAFHMAPSHFKSTLAFNLTEKLPKGDIILEALYSQLLLLHTGFQRHNTESVSNKSQAALLPASLLTLSRLGLMSLKDPYMTEEKDLSGWVVRVGVQSPLELALRESICHSGRVEAARATLDQVKVEGIDTNLAVMQVYDYKYSNIRFESILALLFHVICHKLILGIQISHWSGAVT